MVDYGWSDKAIGRSHLTFAAAPNDQTRRLCIQHTVQCNELRLDDTNEKPSVNLRAHVFTKSSGLLWWRTLDW